MLHNELVPLSQFKSLPDNLNAADAAPTHPIRRSSKMPSTRKINRRLLAPESIQSNARRASPGRTALPASQAHIYYSPDTSLVETKLLTTTYNYAMSLDCDSKVSSYWKTRTPLLSLSKFESLRSFGSSLFRRNSSGKRKKCATISTADQEFLAGEAVAAAESKIQAGVQLEGQAWPV